MSKNPFAFKDNKSNPFGAPTNVTSNPFEAKSEAPPPYVASFKEEESSTIMKRGDIVPPPPRYSEAVSPKKNPFTSKKSTNPFGSSTNDVGKKNPFETIQSSKSMRNPFTSKPQTSNQFLQNSSKSIKNPFSSQASSSSSVSETTRTEEKKNPFAATTMITQYEEEREKSSKKKKNNPFAEITTTHRKKDNPFESHSTATAAHDRVKKKHSSSKKKKNPFAATTITAHKKNENPFGSRSKVAATTTTPDKVKKRHSSNKEKTTITKSKTKQVQAVEVLFRHRVLGIQFDTTAVIVSVSNVARREGVRVGDRFWKINGVEVVSQDGIEESNLRVVEAVKKHPSRPLRVVFLRRKQKLQEKECETGLNIQQQQEQQTKNPFSNTTISSEKKEKKNPFLSTTVTASSSSATTTTTVSSTLEDKLKGKRRHKKPRTPLTTKRLYSIPMTLSEKKVGSETRTTKYISKSSINTNIVFSRLRKRRVNHPIVSYSSGRDTLVLGTSALTLIRWREPGRDEDKKKQRGQNEIPVPRGLYSNTKERIHGVFVDPTGTHVILSLKDGSCFYLHDSTDLFVKLDHREPFVIHSVLWNRFAGTSRDSKNVLLGTQNGRVFQCRFGKGVSSRYDQKDTYCTAKVKEISRVEGIVCGLQLARLQRNETTRYVLLVATTHRSSVRLAQFVGGHSSLLEGPNFAQMFEYYRRNNVTEFVDLPTPPDISQTFRCSLGLYPDDSHGGSGVWALTTGIGALCGTFRTDLLPSPGEKATTSHQLVSYDQNNGRSPTSIMPFLSGKYLLLAWPNQLELVRVRDGHVMETSSLEKFGANLDGIGGLMSVYRQKHKSAIEHLWLCTDRHVIRAVVRPVLSLSQNGEEPWRALLCQAKHLKELSDFAYAKAESAASEDNDISGYFAVRSARAWHHLRDGDTNVAATLFSTCASETLGTPFETFVIPYLLNSNHTRTKTEDRETTTTTLFITKEAFLLGVRYENDLKISSTSSESQRLFDFAKGQKILAVNNNPVATKDMLAREIEQVEDEEDVLSVLVSSSEKIKATTPNESLARLIEMSLRRVILITSDDDTTTTTSTRQKTILALWLLEIRLSLVMSPTSISTEQQEKHLQDVVIEYCEEMESRAAVSMLSSSIICRVAAKLKDDNVLKTLLKCVFVISDMSEDHRSRVVSLLLALRLPEQLSKWFLEMMRSTEDDISSSERRRTLESLVYDTASKFMELSPDISLKTWTHLLPILRHPTRLLPFVMRQSPSRTIAFLETCLNLQFSSSSSGTPSKKRDRLLSSSSTNAVLQAAVSFRGGRGGGGGGSLHHRISLVHRCLIRMYCKCGESDKLIENLERWSQDKDDDNDVTLLSGLSLNWVLRHCSGASEWKAAAFAASRLDRWLLAVEFALKISTGHAVEYALHFASLVQEGEVENMAQRMKRVWMCIARHVGRDGGSENIKRLISLVKEVDALHIGDVLEAIPDHVHIKEIREILQKSLESSIEEIEMLRSQVETLSVSAVRADKARDMLQRRCEKALDEDEISGSTQMYGTCALTKKSLRHGDDVIAFARPYPHVVSASASLKILSNQLSYFERSRIVAVSAALRAAEQVSSSTSSPSSSSPSLLTSSLKRELETLVGTRSPLGSDLLVGSVFEPFIAKEEETSKIAWSFDLLEDGGDVEYTS